MSCDFLAGLFSNMSGQRDVASAQNLIIAIDVFRLFFPLYSIREGVPKCVVRATTHKKQRKKS